MATYKPLLPTAADKERGLTQGLLQLGQSLSASGGYSKMPTSFMSALGQGGAAFGQGYQSEIERAKEGQLQNLQYQQAQAQMEQTRMDIDAAKRKQAQEAQAQLVADQYVNSKTMGGGAAGGQMGPTVGAGAALSAMDPLQRARMEANSVGALQADIAAKAASDAATLDFERKKEIERLKVSGEGGLKAKDIVTLESAANKRVSAALKPSLERINAFKALEATQDNPAMATQQIRDGFSIDGVPINPSQVIASGQGAADLALIFGFMKMLDPTSVVRESEFGMAAQTGGLPGYLKSMLGKVSSGDVLTPTERKKLLGQARNQFDTADRTVQNRLTSERERFASYGYGGLDANRAFSGIYDLYKPRIDRSIFSTGSPPPPMTESELKELEALKAKHRKGPNQ